MNIQNILARDGSYIDKNSQQLADPTDETNFVNHTPIKIAKSYLIYSIDKLYVGFTKMYRLS